MYMFVISTASYRPVDDWEALCFRNQSDCCCCCCCCGGVGDGDGDDANDEVAVETLDSDMVVKIECGQSLDGSIVDGRCDYGQGRRGKRKRKSGRKGHGWSSRLVQQIVIIKAWPCRRAFF